MLGPASARLLAMVLVVTVGSLAPVATASGGPCSGHLLHAVRRRLDGPGQAPRHGRDGRRHRLRHRDREARAGGPQLRTGALDGAVADVRLRLHRAIASWAAATPGDSWLEVEVRGRNSKGVTSSWDLLGRWTSGDKFVRRTTESPPVRRPGRGRRRHLEGPRQRRAGLLAGPPLALPQARLHRPDRGRPRRDDEPSPARLLRGRLHPGPQVGTEADVPASRRWRTRATTRSGVAAARRGARRRRPRWCSATSTRCAAVHLPLRARRAPGSLGRLRRPQDLRRGVRRHGNWPFNTAYAATLAGDAFVTRSGRCARRRRSSSRHPARRRLGLLGCGRVERSPRVDLQRPPGGDRRLHPPGDPVVNDPAAKTLRRCPPRCTTAGSSRTPGCRSPAAWSTSSTTPPTRCRPRRPRPTGRPENVRDLRVRRPARA